MKQVANPHRLVVNTLPAVGVLVALGAAWLLAKSLFFGAMLIVVAIGGVTVMTSPLIGLITTIGTLVVGQLVRLPALGSEGAILPTDLMVPAFLASWLLHGLLRKRIHLPTSPLSWPAATLATIMVLTFVLGSSRVPFLSSTEALKSSFYLLRWLEYTLLIFAVADSIRSEREANLSLRALFWAAGIIAVLGFIQLKIFPDFRFMVPEGWDPHIGRLLSTWFDPNFLAGFLTFVLCCVVGIAATRRWSKAIQLWVLASVLFAAIVLTFSRSGYAAFAAGLGVLTIFKSRRLFILLCLIAFSVVMFVPRVHERIVGAFNVDETAKLRIVSWNNALEVVGDFPLTGIGYNTYRYVQVTYGFQKDAAEHSAGGSDSSLLTFLVTTGPFGLAAEVWFLWAATTYAWSSYRRGATQLVRGMGLGVMAGMASVVVHSFFINSLLLPHMMLTIAVALGTLVGLQQLQKNSDRP